MEKSDDPARSWDGSPTGLLPKVANLWSGVKKKGVGGNVRKYVSSGPWGKGEIGGLLAYGATKHTINDFFMGTIATHSNSMHWCHHLLKRTPKE